MLPRPTRLWFLRYRSTYFKWLVLQAMTPEHDKVSSRRRFVRPGLLLTLSTLLVLLVLVGLGSWQVQRLEWKEALLADRAARLTMAPADWPSGAEVLVIEEDLDNWLYRRVEIEGRPLPDKTIFLANRTRNKVVGRSLWSAFQLTGGAVIMVDRGWVPMTYDLKASPEVGQEKFEAVLRSGGWQGWEAFKPVHDLEKRLFNWPDLPTMAKALELPNLTQSYYLRALPAADQAGPPHRQAAIVDLPNNHFQYALTWYSLAVVLMVIFILFHWRRDEGTDS